MNRDLAGDLAARETPCDAWRCRIHSLSNDADRRALARLLDEDPSLEVKDTIGQQLADLVAARNPSKDLRPIDKDDLVHALLGGVPRHEYGAWVHYPWARRLVHVLPEPEFRELRTDRNRNKITASDQRVLRGKRVGIAGLSVGHAAATTLALEGVGGAFRLADFDTLSLSNLNRLRHGVGDLGLNKAVLSARALYEIDPYLDIEIFPEGVNEERLDEFLDGLDLLVEECDDLYVKVRIREHARAKRIPVLMDTSDRGLLDVERFDLEPSRPLFHGVAGDLEARRMKGLTTKEKIPYVTRILGGDAMSTALAASLIEVKESISTWPQLGSAVTLGGALVTDAARRILLGSFRASGRFYVDLDAIVKDGAGQVTIDDSPMNVVACEEALAAPVDVPRPVARGASTVTPEEARYLVAHAVMAPSGGNTQPWRFDLRGPRLYVRLDVARSESFINFRHLASFTAIGAAAENVALAARTIGLEARATTFPDPRDPTVACVFEFERRAAKNSPLARAIPARATNRSNGTRTALSPADLAELLEAAGSGARVDVVSDAKRLAQIGDVLGRADRARFLSRVMHTELMKELRWTSEEAARTRDGIDIATLDFGASELAVFRVLKDWPTMARVAAWGGGHALAKASRDQLAGASALVRVTVPGTSLDAFWRGGRAMQRLWLAATTRGLGVHPLGLPYMLARVEHEPESYTAEERALLEPIDQEYRSIFPARPNEAEIILLRVVHAPPPAVRSLRRAVEDVFTCSAASTRPARSPAA